MKKNKVIGTVMLGLAFVMMLGTIINNQYVTFVANSLCIMGNIVCGVVLIFIGRESK